MSFKCQKAEKYSPPRLCHGPGSPGPPAAFRAMRMFHAHIIWAPSALPMSTFFFSVLASACIYVDHTEGGWGEVLKFVTCLEILLFLNNLRNRSIVHFCGWVGGGVTKLVIFVDVINV